MSLDFVLSRITDYSDIMSVVHFRMFFNVLFGHVLTGNELRSAECRDFKSCHSYFVSVMLSC